MGKILAIFGHIAHAPLVSNNC